MKKGETFREDNIDNIMLNILLEFRAASMKHPRFNSMHEGYAVIKEELDELWGDVKLNPEKHPERQSEARGEAIQVAAMAFRFIYDLCDWSA